MYWQEWSESLVSGSLGFKWSYVRGIDFVIISLYSDAVWNRNADYTGKHWHQPCFIKEAISGSFFFFFFLINQETSLNFFIVLFYFAGRNSFLSSEERNCGGFNPLTKFSLYRRLCGYRRCDRWVTVWCTVTKATRRSKSSTENVKVICIFTFIWGEGSAPCSPLFLKNIAFMNMHLLFMHFHMSWWSKTSHRGISGFLYCGS